MGAKFAYGCDIDETVIDVARENAIKNGVNIIKDPTQKLLDYREYFENNPKIKNICASDYPPPEGGSKSSISGLGSCYFELGTADKINQKFDFVMANILHNVLFDIMGDLKNLLNDEGYLSLSGILDEKKSVVLEAVKRENLQIIDEIHQDQWVGFVVKLRS
jgi:ribosomal protein L11 methylase PrmA